MFRKDTSLAHADAVAAASITSEALQTTALRFGEGMASELRLEESELGFGSAQATNEWANRLDFGQKTVGAWRFRRTLVLEDVAVAEPTHDGSTSAREARQMGIQGGY